MIWTLFPGDGLVFAVATPLGARFERRGPNRRPLREIDGADAPPRRPHGRRLERSSPPGDSAWRARTFLAGIPDPSGPSRDDGRMATLDGLDLDDEILNEPPARPDIGSMQAIPQSERHLRRLAKVASLEEVLK